MNKYQNTLFNFFISEDNFSIACDVVEHFNTLKKELVQQFWTVVAEKLELRMSDQPGWKIYIAKDFFLPNAMISVYKDQFCTAKDVADISISISNLAADSYYGIYANMQRKDEGFKTVKLHLTHLKQRDWRSDGADSWWPIWQSTRINLNNLDDVRKLHPSQRDEMVDGMVNSFMDFFHYISFKLEDLMPAEVVV